MVFPSAFHHFKRYSAFGRVEIRGVSMDDLVNETVRRQDA